MQPPTQTATILQSNETNNKILDRAKKPQYKNNLRGRENDPTQTSEPPKIPIVPHTNRSYTTGTERIVANYGADSYAAKDGFKGGWFDPPIDFAKEAEAAGAHGETVRDPAELDAALARGLEQVRNGKPALVSIWLKRLQGED